ncbi:elongation factor G [Dethiobacter alkaliphilus]|uniref:elongation factor G n=1 Tax=Dethiobacter alkaliphilus TaxID=427926 RepID=UPI002226A0DD|nr:elongation factor G [Dethiobacter alkaliphilus]MCW3488994.1 elongation factor G [Dethiobacter alkaliphilus]
MKTYTTEKIRNVALVSHGGAGKTSLAEAMIYTTGAINRLGKADAGTTTTDFDPEEVKRQVTINTALAPVEWSGVKINLLDTPGYFDFIGDVSGALRAADAAVVVVSATSGVEVGTEKVWTYADENRLPRLVFVNRMDKENANFDKVMDNLQEFFGHKVAPVQIPIGAEASFKGVVDMVSMKALTFEGDGKKVNEGDIPADLADTVESYREKLIEAVAESDDDLLMKYLEGEPLSDEEVVSGLRKGILTGSIVPVLCGAATENIGTQPLLDMIVSAFPSPADVAEVIATKAGSEEEVAVKIDPNGPVSALVFKTFADPFVGKISYFRVYSGTLKGDSQLHNSSKDKTERLGQVFTMLGKNQINLDQIPAGDIAAVAKLQSTATGDTLCEKSVAVEFAPIAFPEPVTTFAVEPKKQGEEDKVAAGLARFLEEDPTFRMERNTEVKQTLISGMGELHLEIITSRLASKFGVEVDLLAPKIPYKETIRGTAKVEGKHKKQSGGRGQFGHVWIEFSPLESGKYFEFEDKIFGGAVPKQYIPAVEKGLREAMESGILAGYPVVDIKATLYDGSYHNVDSSEMAFKIAANLAFKKGAEQAQPVLLEPVMYVEVTVPDQFMGDIMGDMNSRRGRILGMEPIDGLQVVKANVPMSEMLKYAIDLRSMTQGRGSFTMKFDRYEEVPAHTAEQVIAEAKAEKAEVS